MRRSSRENTPIFLPVSIGVINFLYAKTFLHIREYIFLLAVISFCSCSSPVFKHLQKSGASAKSPYKVYIISKGIHTGLVIPVNDITLNRISSSEFFAQSEYIDFGWGEEYFYQHSGAGVCMGIRAVLLPNSSVMRVEGFSGILNELVGWSDYTVMFNFTQDEFSRLCGYIDESFTRDPEGKLIEVSRKSGGEILFFKSVYTYWGLRTCNTWAAQALKVAGLDVTPLFVITAGGLFNAVKDGGVILKQ